jgi:predicted AlkP superfamily pyrophosphatase or phosphodiesterase
MPRSFPAALVARALVACALTFTLLANRHASAAERPRLVVVVSVDQFCQDYLIRFRDNFAAEGLFRQVDERGAAFANCNHAHAYTVTAPGHSVQLTGAYPGTTGIIGNNWLDRYTGKSVYCVQDDSVEVVGFPTGKGMSPRNLEVTTVGDVLKLASGNRSKVFGIAIKDRAAILMTGHAADTAYWLQDNVWVTSTYYRKDLPAYLRVLNEGKTIERFRGQTWDLLLPKEKYHNTRPDNFAFENPPKGFTASFPHQLLKKGEGTDKQFGDHVLFSPFGNDLTLEGARAVVLGEQLGKDDFPDILAINFSSNDYVGHAFGPYSLEVEDMTYRTDLQLGAFTKFLDEQVGPGKWMLALTADHGVAPIPEFAAEQKLPGIRNPLGNLKQRKTELEAEVRKQIGATEAADKPLVMELSEHQVMFDQNHPALAGEKFSQAQIAARNWLLAQPHVADAITRDDLLAGANGKLAVQFRNSFNPHRSGDVFFAFTPYGIPGGSKGTTHGSPWHYDTNVPLLLIGAGIEPGHYPRAVGPASLAATIARLVNVNFPPAAVEPPLDEALQK